MVVEVGDKREQCINAKTELGEKNLADIRIRFPSSLSLNSKANENGKKSDVRKPC